MKCHCGLALTLVLVNAGAVKAAPGVPQYQRMSQKAGLSRVAPVTIRADMSSSYQGTLRKRALAKEAALRASVKRLEQLLRTTAKSTARHTSLRVQLARERYAMSVNQDLAAQRASRHPPKKRRRLIARANWWAQRSLLLLLQITKALHRHPYRRADEVFLLASLVLASMEDRARRRGKAADAAKYARLLRTTATRLIKGYPRSRFVVDALVLRADSLLAQGKAVDALALFIRADRFKSADLTFYVQLKIVRTYLALGKPRFALSRAAQLIRAVRLTNVLQRAALVDAVRAYAQLGNPHRAYSFITSSLHVKAAVARRTLLQLGYRYYGVGKYADALVIFSDALRRWPKRRKRCAWARAAADSILAGGRRSPKRHLKALHVVSRVARTLARQLGKRHRVTLACQRVHRDMLRY